MKFLKLVLLILCSSYNLKSNVSKLIASRPEGPIEGRLFKGNRNAIFFIEKGKKRLIPDFYTFSKMGFNLTSIEKVADDYLADLPMGEPIKPIPVFRPEDYMYHKNCEDPDRMVHYIYFQIIVDLLDLIWRSTILE